MKNVKEEHKIITSDSKIVLEENCRKIIFENPCMVDYKKVHIDGVVIKEGERCDYLLTSADECEEYFVELKGKDVIKACSQLKMTIKNVGQYTGNRKSFIICTHVPPATTTEIQKQKKEFFNKFSSTLTIKSREFTYTLNKK